MNHSHAYINHTVLSSFHRCGTGVPHYEVLIQFKTSKAVCTQWLKDRLHVEAFLILISHNRLGIYVRTSFWVPKFSVWRIYQYIYNVIPNFHFQIESKDKERGLQKLNRWPGISFAYDENHRSGVFPVGNKYLWITCCCWKISGYFH